MKLSSLLLCSYLKICGYDSVTLAYETQNLTSEESKEKKKNIRINSLVEFLHDLLFARISSCIVLYIEHPYCAEFSLIETDLVLAMKTRSCQGNKRKKMVSLEFGYIWYIRKYFMPSHCLLHVFLFFHRLRR